MEKFEEFDKDLRAVMGTRYDDGKIPMNMPVMECKPAPRAEKREAAVSEAEYEPVPKVQRNLVDRLFDCVVWLGVCGGIAMLLWWFWQNGLMAMEAAYPCILACGVIGSFGAGINMAR